MTCAKDYSEKRNLNLSLIVIQIIKRKFIEILYSETFETPTGGGLARPGPGGGEAEDQGDPIRRLPSRRSSQVEYCRELLAVLASVHPGRNYSHVPLPGSSGGRGPCRKGHR